MALRRIAGRDGGGRAAGAPGFDSFLIAAVGTAGGADLRYSVISRIAMMTEARTETPTKQNINAQSARCPAVLGSFRSSSP